MRGGGGPRSGPPASPLLWKPRQQLCSSKNPGPPPKEVQPPSPPRMNPGAPQEQALVGGLGCPAQIKRGAKLLTAGPLEVALVGMGTPARPRSASLWWQQAPAEVTSFSPDPGGGGGGGRGKGRVCPIVYLFIWPVGLQWGIWELSRPLHLCGLSRYFSLPCRSRQRTAPALPLPRPGCPPGSLGSSVRVAWVTPGPFLQTANWERRNPPASSSRVGGKHAETPLLPPLCPPI